MEYKDDRVVCFTMFTFLLFGFAYIFVSLSNPAKTKYFVSIQDSLIQPTRTHSMKRMYGDELEEALAEATDENKTLIIAVVNKAYAGGDKPMLDLFMDGFWLGDETRNLTDHLLIVAVDQTAYERCRYLRLHCYKLKTDGVDFDGDEKLYMSDAFIKMMWSRTQFLGNVLRRGYNFIFTDADVLWLRNPFPRLNLSESIDFQISTDHFNNRGETSEDTTPPINTGFYMIRSNNKTIALFDAWYDRKDNSTGLKEQDVLQLLIRQGTFQRLGLNVKFLDTVYFSGFCENSRDVRAVTTVHANCCRGISAKVADLTAVVHDWKRFKSSPPSSAAAANGSSAFTWSPHWACINSWKHP